MSDDTSKTRDIYPLNAPGMPLVGEDFIATAINTYNDTVTKLQGSGKSAKLTVGPELEEVVRSALYDGGALSINVTIKGDKKKMMPIIGGHLYGPRRRGKFITGSFGPEPADVMIIGKQLGLEELEDKRAIAGPACRLLDDAMHQLGLDGETISKFYVTTILKTGNPEGSDVWRSSWVKNFEHLLQQELRIVKPRIILCLGADAVKSLLGKNMNLSKMEAQIVEYTYDIRRSYTEAPKTHTALVIACTHPAAVLRTPEMESKFELGLSRFIQLVNGHRFDQVESDVDHRLITNEDELSALADEILACGKNNIIAMDCEWHGEHPQNSNAYLRTIQLSWAHKKAAAIILRHAGGAPAFEHYKRVMKDGKRYRTKSLTTDGAQSTVRRLMHKILADNRACGHFFNADLEWLVPYGIDCRPQFAAPATWQECKDKGGLDTALMAHAVDEIADLTLTGQALRYTTAPRYDTPVIKWKEDYCRENGIKVKDLDGYGECPGEVLYPYAMYDADVTRRIAVAHMRNLSCDRFGNNCWEAFWVSQRATAAVLEMKLEGIPVDNKRIDELTSLYMTARQELYDKIREYFKWPDLNLNSVNHVRELLYGEKYNGQGTPETGVVRLRPEGAISLYIEPILTTDKRPLRWEELTEEEKVDKSPSTNRVVLSLLYHSAEQLQVRAQDGTLVLANYKEQLEWIRDYRYVGQILKSVLRPPTVDDDNNFVTDEDENWEYDAGLPGAVCDDNKIRTTIYQTKETGRWSSARPPLQNLSKKREPDYKRILGDAYRWPLRSVLCAPPGYVMVDADYIGAELFSMAIMSGDAMMIEHATRNQLPENHPDYYDIHSNVAKFAFNLDCEPTKAGLAKIGKKSLRIVAKSVIFGIAYGRQAKAVALAAKEEGIDVTEQDAQKIIDTIFDMYPELERFFLGCRTSAVQRREAGPPARRWICGPFGRFRRFPETNDRKLMGDLERQAQNFPEALGK